MACLSFKLFLEAGRSDNPELSTVGLHMVQKGFMLCRVLNNLECDPLSQSNIIMMTVKILGNLSNQCSYNMAFN